MSLRNNTRNQPSEDPTARHSSDAYLRVLATLSAIFSPTRSYGSSQVGLEALERPPYRSYERRLGRGWNFRKFYARLKLIRL
jgi:hypothetical protein